MDFSFLESLPLSLSLSLSLSLFVCLSVSLYIAIRPDHPRSLYVLKAASSILTEDLLMRKRKKKKSTKDYTDSDLYQDVSKSVDHSWGRSEGFTIYNILALIRTLYCCWPKRYQVQFLSL